MEIRDEIVKISKLKYSGLALLDYIETICPGIQFKLKGRKWVPDNKFVTFTIQHVRSQTIAISLRGNPKEFPPFQEITLKPGMGNGVYSECLFESAVQLPAVAFYIKRAFEIYSQGRSRKKKGIIITEL
jgi:hypothetical protein